MMPRARKPLERSVGATPSESFDDRLDQLIKSSRRRDLNVRDVINDEYQRERRVPGAHDRYIQRMLRYLAEPVCFGSGKRREWSLEQTTAWETLLADEHVLEPFVKPLQSALRSREPDIRRRAAEYITWLGFDRFVSQVVMWLRSGDAQLVACVLTGLDRALYDRSLSRAFQRRVFEALVPLVCGARRLNTKDPTLPLSQAPQVLSALDRTEARRILTSRACLHENNPGLLVVLWALNEDEGTATASGPDAPDPALLWPIFDATPRKRSERSRFEQLQAAILMATASRDPARTRIEAQTLLRVIPKDHTITRASLRDALLRCANLPDPHAMLMALNQRKRRFVQAAAQVLLAFDLSQHVNSDGLEGYFDNAGSDWKAAHAGLTRLQLGPPAELLAKAAAIFWTKRNPNPDALLEVAATQSKQQTNKISSIGDKFSPHTTSIESAVRQYMLAHPTQFR